MRFLLIVHQGHNHRCATEASGPNLPGASLKFALYSGQPVASYARRAFTKVVSIVVTWGALWIAVNSMAIGVAPLAAQETNDNAAARQVWPESLLTRAESSQYQATSRAADVERVLRGLAERSERIRLVEIGQSVEKRPIVAAIASQPPLSDPAARPADDRRLVVLLLGGIHAGECDGKEALLMLLRELAHQPDHPWWQRLILLVVPNFNVDGGERVGREHRPGQNGPAEGAGRRENAQDLDLNRDYIKLDSPEVRALVAWAHRWDIDVFIDTHTTNGSRHRYAVTFDIPHCPAAPQAPVEYLRKELLPAVQRRLADQGMLTQYYGNFNSERTRWTTYGIEPRYGTEYFGLCGCYSILAESYTYAPFAERVRATREFVRACLDELAWQHGRLADLRRNTIRQIAASGRDPTSEELVPIAGELAPWPDAPSLTIQSYRSTDGREEPAEYVVEHWAKGQATRQVRRPFAYLLDHESSRIADRLLMHGLRLERLTKSHTLEVTQYVLKHRRELSTYQNHRMVQLDVDAVSVRRDVPAGTYVVRLDQPRALLAVWLLEPQSQDGLGTWNFFDRTAAEPGERFPVERLESPVDLAVEPIQAVEAAQLLDLDQLYGATKQVAFEWPRPEGIRWMAGRDEYLRFYEAKLWKVDAATGAMSLLCQLESIAAALAKLPEISPQEARRLAQSVHLLSPQADAQIITHNNDLYYVTLDGSRAQRLTFDPHAERLVTFSPDGRLAAFVRQHNLHVVSLQDGRQWSLTTQGDADHLYGLLDWVYQEEVYGRGNFRGYWWSPDSQRIALLVLDETPVHRYTITDHIPYRQTLEVGPYPKAGDPLPVARLAIVPAGGGELTWVDLDDYPAEDRLVVRVSWHPSSQRLLVQVQNRRQTWLDLLDVDARTGRPRRLLRETSPAWVEPLAEPRWLDDQRFLWLSTRSGTVHLYTMTVRGPEATSANNSGAGHNSGAGQPAAGTPTDFAVSAQALTQGDWEIRELLGLSGDRSWVYFTAVDQDSLQQHLYRVPVGGGERQKVTVQSGSHDVRLSDTGNFYIDTVSAWHVPPAVTVCRSDGQPTHVLAPSWDDTLRYYRLARPQRVRYTARDGTLLDGVLLVPPDFDSTGTKKYPVLCYVYGGPQAPVVRDRWGGRTAYLWHQMLAQQGICVWISDNRAATYRGMRYTWPIHGRLGELELQDLDDGVAWLASQPWVDEQRIGIWGWSYGGYLTAYALTHSRRFRLGIAGAPVTDWRNYDAIYTERLMNTPQDNPDGYRRSSLVRAASQLHGHLVLIHGDADDNVHLANTLQLAESLQRAGKPFTMMIYPRNGHGITQPEQYRHLQRMMTDWINQWLLH